MGFDINVYMMTMICPTTGKAYYNHYDEEKKSVEKVYEIPEVLVPEELRKYITGRGKIFHAYTEYFNDMDVFDVGVDGFLDYYPDWDVVKENSYYEVEKDFWTDKDHEGFKKLLEWCMEQEVFYRVSWSY